MAKAKPAHQKLVHLSPFLDRLDLPPVKSGRDGAALIAIGMFRDGDKLASYGNLSAALAVLGRMDWSLKIVGAGPAEGDVRGLFAPFGERVSFLGQLAPEDVTTVLQQSDVFVWPGVNEAFGMVYLEAQSVGLTVVAEDRPGVRDVVAPSGFLVPQNDADCYARAIENALSNRSDGTASRAFVAQTGLRPTATQTLATALQIKEGLA